MYKIFNCDKCGLCCQNLKISSLYKDLDRGDGTCIFYNEDTKLCNIYENRPIICNIEKFYKVYFAGKIKKYNYYKLNYEACKKLKEKIY